MAFINFTRFDRFHNLSDTYIAENSAIYHLIICRIVWLKGKYLIFLWYEVHIENSILRIFEADWFKIDLSGSYLLRDKNLHVLFGKTTQGLLF